MEEQNFTLNQAIKESERCLLCYDAPCSQNCPADTNPALFIRKLRFKNIKGAIRVIKNNNILGGVCGRLCPTSRLCEQNCSICPLENPIKIGKIQEALMRYYYQSNFKVFEKQKLTGLKVAVVGGGPAGIACAAEVAKAGHKTVIFEAKESLGGAVTYGVPSLRCSNDFLQKDLQDLQDLDVEIKTNSPIKGEKSVEDLLKKGFDAVFIGIGLWEPFFIKENNIPGVLNSIGFLQLETDKSLIAKVKDKKIAVIGGGSVAIDCAEVALNMGAKDVYLIYRRSWSQMPAEEKEKVDAADKGVQFLLLNQPKKFIGDSVLKGIEMVRTQLGKADSSGRRSPIEVTNSNWILNVDLAIEAIGNQAEEECITWFPNVATDKKNLIVVNEETGSTNVEGIFAGGDIVSGASLVVEAVKTGKKAGKSICKYLENKKGE